MQHGKFKRDSSCLIILLWSSIVLRRQLSHSPNNYYLNAKHTQNHSRPMKKNNAYAPLPKKKKNQKNVRAEEKHYPREHTKEAKSRKEKRTSLFSPANAQPEHHNLKRLKFPPCQKSPKKNSRTIENRGLQPTLSNLKYMEASDRIATTQPMKRRLQTTTQKADAYL